MNRLLLLPLALAFAACADVPDETPDPVGPTDDIAAWEKAYVERGDEKADSTGCSGVRVPDRPTFGKKIALTFDDGPSPATTPKVMEILRKHNAPATFFVNGRRFDEAGMALAKEIVADPLFMLGNHTWSHVNMSEQNAATAATQIDKTHEVMVAAGETPKFFRFPFGASSCMTAEAVRSRGYSITGWHIDSADWCYAAGGGYCKPSTFRYVEDSMRGDMTAYVMSQVRATEGGVLLFHDIHPYTVANLDAVLTTLENAGYTFVGLDDTTTFPKLNGTTAPVVPQNYIGSACQTDADCPFGEGRCHQAGFCTMGCEGYCPDREGRVATFCTQDTHVADPAGICVVVAVPENGHCADVPGTIDANANRYIGSSNAPEKEREACIPAPPQQ